VTVVEEQVNGVENMIYFSSVASSDGSFSISVTFKIGTDVDMAQVQVQNRVNAALPRLPEEVRRQGVIVRKRSPSMTIVLSLFSPDKSLDPIFVSNYAYLQIKDVLTRLPGVGDLDIIGTKDYCMRIWVDPKRQHQETLQLEILSRQLTNKTLRSPVV
jgi:multidrug efflux pump subunit AcrB